MSEDGKCGACGKALGSFEAITVVGEGDRCHGCFNRGMADRLGVAFDNTPLQPIVIADADGVPHAFQIRSMLVATGHELAELEITNDQQLGYRSLVHVDHSVLSGTYLLDADCRLSGTPTDRRCRIETGSDRIEFGTARHPVRPAPAS